MKAILTQYAKILLTKKLNMRDKVSTIGTDQAGIVLVTTVIMVLVMTILAVSLISITVGQALSNQHQINRIKAEQLAKGAFWYNYMNLITGSAATPLPEILDNKTFIVLPIVPGGIGPNGTRTYAVTVSY